MEWPSLLRTNGWSSSFKEEMWELCAGEWITTKDWSTGPPLFVIILMKIKVTECHLFSWTSPGWFFDRKSRSYCLFILPKPNVYAHFMLAKDGGHIRCQYDVIEDWFWRVTATWLKLSTTFLWFVTHLKCPRFTERKRIFVHTPDPSPPPSHFPCSRTLIRLWWIYLV